MMNMKIRLLSKLQIERHKQTRNHHQLLFLYIELQNLTAGVRCCRDHVDNQRLRQDAVEQIFAGHYDELSLNTHDVQNILFDFRSFMTNVKSFDFDDPTSLSDESYLNFTDQFENLLGYMFNMRNSHNRSVRTALAVFLMKMRLGISNRVLGSLFHFKNQRTVAHLIHSVRVALMQDFTSHYLGLQHIDRQTALDHHQTAIATELFTTNSNQLCIIMDGTYIYIQKSSNNEMQRRTYSFHKHRHLVKPMIITTTTGYILCCIGPFLADGKNNDAPIAKQVLYSNGEGILSWLHDEDIVIIDRGFRDAVKTVELFGFHAAMPHFLNGSKQFSTTDANYNRCVAKSRWAVESANGKIKHFKYFNQTIQNASIPFLSDYLHIVCSIINAYQTPAIKDAHSGIGMATEMLSLLDTENTLQKHLSSMTNTRWRKYDAKMCIFPILSIDDIRRYCFGNYQLKQAKGYILEHLQPSQTVPTDLEFIVELCEQQSDLIRIRFSSRHSTQKHYIATVQFDNYKEEPILGWYCTCPRCSGVLGCCSHTAALLWYLGVCRAEYDTTDHPLSAQYLLETVDDCIQYADPVTTDDEDDDNGVRYTLNDHHSESDSETSDD
ncbi:unnamed protein product [Adineta ricciae]|uniref:SWIM-type domain-containing protein n=1 Tax=Adineta ricciae TaxID=249248 RepID=A0A815VPK4_ADIRI|nr:unnamed protein product [Adineta ricciae]